MKGADADGWRKTEESMPSNGAVVLFWVNGTWETGVRSGREWIAERTDSYNESLTFTDGQVTHWQPGPEPPIE